MAYIIKKNTVSNCHNLQIEKPWWIVGILIYYAILFDNVCLYIKVCKNTYLSDSENQLVQKYMDYKGRQEQR